MSHCKQPVLDYSHPHVAPLCIHDKLFELSLEQPDGVNISVHPTALLRCPQTNPVVTDQVAVGVGDKVGVWRCIQVTGEFAHPSYF